MEKNKGKWAWKQVLLLLIPLEMKRNSRSIVSICDSWWNPSRGSVEDSWKGEQVMFSPPLTLSHQTEKL